MNQKNKEQKERENVSYHCKICKNEYTETEAKDKKGFCCDNELMPMQDLYRSDPSPTGA